MHSPEAPARGADGRRQKSAYALALIRRLSLVHGPEDRRAVIAKASAPSEPFVLSFVNANAFNLCYEDPDFPRLLLHADLLVRDGIGMDLCCRLFGRPPGLDMNGTDLIPEILRANQGKKVALFGTNQEWLDEAVRAVRGMGTDVCVAVNGFRPETEYLPALLAHRPDIVILGMGMPKQEKLAESLAQEAGYPVTIINGGAILDFLGRRVPRAPLWVRRINMEWLFRMLIEPRRLWRRYTVGVVAFFVRIVILRLWGARLVAASPD